VARSAPLQGQHSRDVFASLAGLADEDYERLVARGVSGRGPVSSSTVENQA